MSSGKEMNNGQIRENGGRSASTTTTSTVAILGGTGDIQPSASRSTCFTQRGGTYTPQFAASSSLILSRIRGNEGRVNHNSGSNEKNSGVRDSGASSTISLPHAITSQTVVPATSHQDFIAFISSSLKRKRPLDSDIPDFTKSTISFPAERLLSQIPGQQVLLAGEPRHSTQGDTIRDIRINSTRTNLASTEDVRQRRISSITEGVVPAKSELVGFYGGNTSDSERTEYFMTKKRTDLLNILSFCDQVRPQLLPDILVSVSKKHPDLPIFDSPNWSNSHQAASSAGNSSIITASRSIGRPRHGHTLLNPKLRQRQKNAKRALKRLISARAEEITPEEDDDVEDDTVPSTWPKAGEGLYSKLPAETEDRAYLADDGDGTSFSHFLIDKLGNPLPVSSCA